MNDRDHIRRLIEASSLDTPEAKALRESVSQERAREIVAHAHEIEEQQMTTQAALAARGEITTTQAVQQMLEYADGGLTFVGAVDLIANWRRYV